jgi:multiple sugar transport system substrate-binding protein
MSMSYFADYAQRGALLDLSEVIGSAIDTSKLDADVAASGKIADGVYGVGQSSISHAVFTNPKAWADAGLHAPEEDWTWESFADLASRYAKKAGSGRYGTTDAGGMLQIFEVFVRQNGRQLFTADGTGLAATASDVEAWLAYWQRLRQDRAAPPLNVSTETGDFNTNLLSQGKAPLTFGWVQQVTFYQPLVDDPLDIMPVPGRTAGSLSGQFLKALDFWVISSASKNTTAAAALIDYLINDQRAVTDLGLTLGVPPSKNARTELGAKPHSAEAKAIAYIDKITDSVGKPPGAWPKGYSEISDALNRVNQDVGFGRTDPAKGAARFVDEGSQALG